MTVQSKSPVNGGEFGVCHSVALVDQCEGVRFGLSAYFDGVPEVRVAGSYPGMAAFIESDAADRCDIVICDLSRLEDETDALVPMLHRKFPRFIAYTYRSKHRCRWLLAQAAFAGYVNKNSGLKTLKKAINEVADGRTYIDPSQNPEEDSAVQPRDALITIERALSLREEDTVRLVSQGFSNKEIAEKMKVSTSSVDTYRRRAANKLNCLSRSQLVAAYRDFERDNPA